MSLEFVALSDGFAREVRNIALWDRAQPEQRAALREAFSRHSLLVFRRQSLSEDELVEFATMFGRPAVYVERSWHSSRPEVSSVSNLRNEAGELIGGLASRELNWHTDQSYNAHPVTGCFLYAQVVPASGSITRWADLYGAYDSLPIELREQIEDAVGVFSYAARTHTVIPGGDGTALNQSYAERIRNTPDVKHPLVNRHPVSGRKSIYIDPGTLIGIDGMTAEQAAPVLESLQRYAISGANVYSHNWQVGDLVLWDNAVCLHQRDAFSDHESRLMKRMIIELPADEHIQPALIA